MPAIDFINAAVDWRFLVSDVRDASGAALDLSGYEIKVTFCPDAEPSDAITSCATDDGQITVSTGATGQGSTISIVSLASSRTWRPCRPMLVVGDLLMLHADAVAEVKRLQFIALPSTT